MEYIVVKIPGEPDIMGKVQLLDSVQIVIKDPVYLRVRDSMSGGLAIGMQRATMFADEDKHILSLDLSKVLSYYSPAEGVTEYYEGVITAYVEYHDAQLIDQLTEEPVDQQDEKEFIKKMSKIMLDQMTANTVYH